MQIHRIEVPGLAHYSYIVSSGGRAVVIDPKRDADTYVRYAADNGLRIEQILETHIHADYTSGALQLQHATGAELLLSGHDEGERYQYTFPHREIRDGDELEVGQVRIVALYTPGHTPEHVSLLAYDKRRCPDPVALFSGDFALVGSLGRPDLIEGEEGRLAAQLYESVRQIGSLPDGLELYPAHGAGSLCAAGISDRPHSTLGHERSCNTFMRGETKQSFMERVLGSRPELPPYYGRMKQLNADGPALLDGIPGGRALPADEFRRYVESGDALIIDLRRPEAFGGAHIPGSLNIGAGKMFVTWAAWVVPYGRPVCLVGDDAADYEEARRALVRVGFDDIRGYLTGGIASWIEAGFEQAHLPLASVAELNEARGRGAFVLDVRSDPEWKAGHIPGATHIPGGDLPGRTGELDRERPVHVICSTGYRSGIAASVLRRAGFRTVFNIVGGMTAWNNRQLETTAAASGVSG